MKTICTVIGFFLFIFSLNSQNSASFDFNTVGQLGSEFTQGGSAVNITQSTNSGIGSTGAINITSSVTNEVFVTKQGYSNGGVGSIYTFSTYFKSVWNSGYGGIGFTTDANATHQNYAHATNSIGISVHGGGYIFNSGATTNTGSWTSAISDLLNNGSPDDWYKVVFTVESKAGDVFDVKCEVFPANSDGTLINTDVPPTPDATQTASFTNSTMASANIIYAYFGFGGSRISDFDNYTIDLTGSSVIQPGKPIVIGDAVLSSGNIDLSGEVTDDRGSSVTDRGFVYSTTNSSPEVGVDIEVPSGTGTGTFTSQITSPPDGTYYTRSYATNTNGTSYGTSKMIIVSNLPVEMISFDVEPVDGRNVALRWVTATETNNKHFEIERSYDGVRFEVVDIIEGRGNSSEKVNYSYLDRDIPNGQDIIYYRLKQQDFDGQSSYSQVRSIQLGYEFDFAAWPNPVRDNLMLNFTGEEDHITYTISKFDGSIIVEKDAHIETDDLSIDVSNLAKGIYILSVSSEFHQKSILLSKD